MPEGIGPDPNQQPRPADGAREVLRDILENGPKERAPKNNQLFDPKDVQVTPAEQMIADARAKLAGIDERKANRELPYQVAQDEKKKAS